MNLQKALLLIVMIGTSLFIVRSCMKPGKSTAPSEPIPVESSVTIPKPVKTPPLPLNGAQAFAPIQPTTSTVIGTQAARHQVGNPPSQPLSTATPTNGKLAPTELKARIDAEKFPDRAALLKATQPFRLPMLDGGNTYDGAVLIKTSGFIHWNTKQVSSMVIERDNLNIRLIYEDPSTGQVMTFSVADQKLQARIYKNDPFRLVVITPEKTFQARYTARDESVQYGPDRIDHSSIASGYIYGASEIEGRFALISCDPTDSSCPSEEAVRKMVDP